MTEYSVREQRGWYLYDWANSAFPTTVIALFLGPYITVLAKAAADSQGFIHPLGIKIDARSYWSYLISLSVILQVLWFKSTGRRIFRMSPIHHHFELEGWKESKIIARFWIVALVLSLFALTTLKIR